MRTYVPPKHPRPRMPPTLAGGRAETPQKGGRGSCAGRRSVPGIGFVPWVVRVAGNAGGIRPSVRSGVLGPAFHAVMMPAAQGLDGGRVEHVGVVAGDGSRRIDVVTNLCRHDPAIANAHDAMRVHQEMIGGPLAPTSSPVAVVTHRLVPPRQPARPGSRWYP